MTQRKFTKAERELLDKIRSLSPERVAQVLQFVDFQLERELVRDMARRSEDAFSVVWDNPDDADYDQL